MTDQEKARIAALISAQLETAGPIRLLQLTPLLQQNGIDREAYGGLRPKQFIAAHFPQFRVQGTNGLETIVRASDAEAPAPEAMAAAPTAAAAEMTDTQRDHIAGLLAARLAEGPLKLSQLAAFLRAEGISTDIYGGLRPKRWLAQHFPAFTVQGTNGLETICFADAAAETSAPASARPVFAAPSGDAAFETDAPPAAAYAAPGADGPEEAFIIQEETIRYDRLAALLGIDLASPAHRIGFVNYCVEKNGFINHLYENGFSQPGSQSVIFDPAVITTMPAELRFNTLDRIYLVLYSVNGRRVNPKTGEEHPILQTRMPIRILRILPRQHYAYIKVLPDQVVLGRKCPVGQPAPLTDAPLEDTVRILQVSLAAVLRRRPYILASDFPEIARICGVANYRAYANSVEAFFAAYLPAYTIRTNVEIAGTVYPGLIVKNGEASQAPVQGLQALDALFDAGEYAAFLSAEAFRSIPPQQLPQAYLEKALSCAERLLFGAERPPVRLDEFQRGLFYAATPDAFIVKDKKTRLFSEALLCGCSATALAPLQLPQDKAAVIELLEAAGRERGVNTHYGAITARFAACENRLTPHFYLIRAFVQSDAAAVQRLVDEYCKKVRDARRSAAGALLTPAQRLRHLDRLLQVLFCHLPEGMQLSALVRSNIVVAFMQYGQMERLQKTVPLWDAAGASPEWQVVRLYFEADSWSEQDFIGLLQSGVNIEHVQRCLALLWGRCPPAQPLPRSFLRLLAWVVVHDGPASIDEVLWYPAAAELPKAARQEMLIGAVENIYDWAAEEPVLYPLAAYIVTALAPGADYGEDVPAAAARRQRFDRFSDAFYDQMLQQQQAAGKTAADLPALFDIFRLDTPHYLRLQADYAVWRRQALPPAEQDAPALLEALYAQKAWAAFIEAFDALAHTGTAAQEASCLRQYIQALTGLHRYAEAIVCLQQTQALPAQEKDPLLVRIIAENFRENGIDEAAWRCFGDTLPPAAAIAVLLQNWRTDQAAAISALIALYIHRQEHIKALYLIVAFGLKTDIGYARLYGQMRGYLRQFADFYSYKSHYDIITLAFTTQSPEGLVEFLDWAKSVPLPLFKDHGTPNAFRAYYNSLIADAHNKDVWVALLNYLSRAGLERTAWRCFVCETVLRRVLGYAGSFLSQGALDYVLANTERGSYPSNFLPLVFDFIRTFKDEALCRRVTALLQDAGVHRRLIDENRWQGCYQADVEAYKAFCRQMQETAGVASYYELLAATGLGLSPEELRTLPGAGAAAGAGRRALFIRICNNYLRGADTQQMLEVLNSDDWNGLSDTEAALLRLLRTVYADDDVLLAQGDLFCDELEVRRVKLECVRIVRDYPDTTALAAFVNTCQDPLRRLVVCAQVFDVLYDQDLYEQQDRKFDDLADPRLFSAYLLFLESAYRAQLRHNVSFPFFYKRWRYLKMYLARAIRCGGAVEDADILALMQQHDHYDDFYAADYLPFRQDVQAFMGFAEVSPQAGRRFLFALLIGDAGDLAAACAAMLTGLPAAQQAVCRRLIQALDYRYFNTELLRQARPALGQRDFAGALALARAASDYAADALQALQNDPDPAALQLFDTLAFAPKPSDTVWTAETLDMDTFVRHQALLVPLVCARQFVFYIRDRFRKQVIQKPNGPACEKYKYLADYLTAAGRPEGPIYDYLRALQAGLRGERAIVKAIADELDLPALVPQAWRQEAQRLQDYANSRLDVFKPDRSILDGSQDGQRGQQALGFAARLLEQLFPDAPPPTGGEATGEVYARYLSAADERERTKAGLQLLACKPEHYKTAEGGAALPPQNELALDVGLLLLRPGASLPLEAQLAVITDVYRLRQAHSKQGYTDRLQKLDDRFNALIAGGMPLRLWVEHAALIEDFLRQTQNLQDFTQLRKRILAPCAKIDLPTVSYDEKEARYEALLEGFGGLTSPFSSQVMQAVQNECRALRDGVRLSIQVEAPDDAADAPIVTDGQVYFSIKNTGKRAVAFDDDRLTVVLRQQDQPQKEIPIENIRRLQSGFITGGRAELIIGPADRLLPVELRVIYTTPAGVQQTVCAAAATLRIAPPCQIQLPTGARYGVQRAVTQEEMLFGRQREKEELAASIPGGVTLLYGPSRIGKTSLMNWVQNRLAVDAGNVMTILFGGEDGMGKESDYVRNFMDSSRPIPFDDDDAMSRYLLADTLLYGLTQWGRLDAPSRAPLPETLQSDLVRVLQDQTTNLQTKYYQMDRLLAAAGVQLWLLLDEFQQVVERWNPQESCEFVQICSLLSGARRSKPENIKLVICGSDDLLRHMILEHSSVWKNTFRSTIAVEALKQPWFSDMIRQDRAMANTNLRYAPAALEALFSYTGGVALYGKEICNAVLEDIRDAPDRYRDRTVIYTWDIAQATQRLLDRQNDELSTRDREGISGIYTAVTKNLDEDTDMQMLWYMAKWLYENAAQDGFSKSVFTDAPLADSFAEHLDDALQVALARGILRKVTSHYSGEEVYVFNTLFYYFAFYGSAQDNLQPALIFAPEDAEALLEDEAADPYAIKNLMRVATTFNERYTPQEQSAFVGALMMSGDAAVQDKLKRLAGTTQTGHIVNGNVNILQVNQIAQSLNGLSDMVRQLSAGGTFSDEALSGHLAGMPRLQLLPAGAEVNEEDELSRFDTDAYVETVEEGVRQSFQNDVALEGKTLEDWAQDHMDQLTQMGADAEDIAFVMTLQPRDRDSVLIALYLRCLFDEIAALTQHTSTTAVLDYSPITIMLCKTLERQLRERHLPLYLDRTVWANPVKTYSAGGRGKSALITFGRSPTMGTFTTALSAMFDISPNDPERLEKESNRDNFIARTGRGARSWRPYLDDLNVAQLIRNMTAHVEPVEQEQCDRLVKTVFHDKLLANTIDYVGDVGTLA